jgi:hypothetical protein
VTGFRVRRLEKILSHGSGILGWRTNELASFANRSQDIVWKGAPRKNNGGNRLHIEQPKKLRYGGLGAQGGDKYHGVEHHIAIRFQSTL